ncbi:MAG: hypothetical protein QGD94_09955 [Planctomycetia bacterium]|nr:hypothetical protein [Planctomycetia bacterium]
MEFCMSLPIIIAVVGLTIYFSFAMLTKQETLIAARHSLWNAAAYGAWSQMNLDPNWNPTEGTSQGGNTPRGVGKGLDDLAQRIQPAILALSGNGVATDYFDRVWGNLPARHEQHSTKQFDTKTQLWSWLDSTVKAAHYRDSSEWTIWHINAWKICQENTLADFHKVFHGELDVVEEPFEYTRDRILKNLFDREVTGEE